MMGDVPRSGDWGDHVDSYYGFCQLFAFQLFRGPHLPPHLRWLKSVRCTQFKREDCGPAAPLPRLSAGFGATIALSLQSAGPGTLSISGASWGVGRHVPPPRAVPS